MAEQRVSLRFAKAILNTAEETGITDEILTDFMFLRKAIKESKDLYNLLHSPIVRSWKKKEVFKEIFKPFVNELTLNFILLMTEKHRENLIDDIIEEYVKIDDELHGRIPVKISSAVELSDETKAKVLEKIKDITNKTLLPEYVIDENLKGGVTINIDDWVYDVSVKNQLDKLYKRLAQGVDF